jgi:biopolymer transport protein TolR
MRPPLVSRAHILGRVIVTPIIDVALVLVIILLITAPMLSVADLQVRLPAAHTRDVEEQGYVSVTVGRDGRIAVEDRIVSRPEQVAPMLHARLGQIGRPDALVVVRADSKLSHALVRQVIEEVRAGGAVRLAIATRQKGGRRP